MLVSLVRCGHCCGYQAKLGDVIKGGAPVEESDIRTASDSLHASVLRPAMEIIVRTHVTRSGLAVQWLPCVCVCVYVCVCVCVCVRTHTQCLVVMLLAR